MGSENFPVALRFIRDIVSAFPISVDGVHVGMVLITTKPKVEFDLGVYTQKSTVNAVAMKTTYPGGKTETADAIAEAETLFEESGREAVKVIWFFKEKSDLTTR